MSLAGRGSRLLLCASCRMFLLSARTGVLSAAGSGVLLAGGHRSKSIVVGRRNLWAGCGASFVSFVLVLVRTPNSLVSFL